MALFFFSDDRQRELLLEDLKTEKAQKGACVDFIVQIPTAKKKYGPRDINFITRTRVSSAKAPVASFMTIGRMTEP